VVGIVTTLKCGLVFCRRCVSRLRPSVFWSGSSGGGGNGGWKNFRGPEASQYCVCFCLTRQFRSVECTRPDSSQYATENWPFRFSVKSFSLSFLTVEPEKQIHQDLDPLSAAVIVVPCGWSPVSEVACRHLTEDLSGYKSVFTLL